MFVYYYLLLIFSLLDTVNSPVIPVEVADRNVLPL